MNLWLLKKYEKPMKLRNKLNNLTEIRQRRNKGKNMLPVIVRHHCENCKQSLKGGSFTPFSKAIGWGERSSVNSD